MIWCVWASSCCMRWVNYQCVILSAFLLMFRSFIGTIPDNRVSQYFKNIIFSSSLTALLLEYHWKCSFVFTYVVLLYIRKIQVLKSKETRSALRCKNPDDLLHPKLRLENFLIFRDLFRTESSICDGDFWENNKLLTIFTKKLQETLQTFHVYKAFTSVKSSNKLLSI